MWTRILALAASAWVESEHAKARLIADDAIAPGGSASVALEIVAEDGWHTYWVNPGDAGMATRVEWAVPKGFAIGELAWPAPIRFETEGIASFGYEGRVVLPAALAAKKRAKGPAAIRAKASWLVCREICLPGEAELALAVPVKKGALRTELAEIPERAEWEAHLKGWALVIRAPVELRDAYFFPERAGLVDPSAAQTLTRRDDGSYSISLPRAANAKLDGAKEIGGVLVSGDKAWRITAKVER